MELSLLSVPHHFESSTSRVVDQVSKLGDSMHSSHAKTIRRLDDVQCSIYKSATIHDQRIERHEEQFAEIRDMFQALMLQASSSDHSAVGRRLTGMMASKPALLRDISDIVNSQPTMTTSNFVATGHQGGSQKEDSLALSNRGRRQALLPCGCRLRRHVTRKSSRWLTPLIFKETIMESKHELGCQYSQSNTSDYHLIIDVLFTGLRRYLSIAFSFSLSLTHGAGGNSIGRTFRYFPMVDSRTSPAFNVISELIGLTDPGELVCSQPVVLHHGISKLRQIFRSGLASPSHVNENGDTLIGFALLFVSRSFMAPYIVLNR